MLNLHFLNVENGDCIIVEYINDGKKSFGLIDCNRTSRRASPARDKLRSLGADHLEFVCITHPDADHYTGILDVLDAYDGRISAFLTFPLASLLTDQDRLKKYARKLIELAERGDDEEIASRHLEFVEILRVATDRFLPNDWIEVTGDHDRIGISGFAGVEFFGIGPPKRTRGAIVQTVLDPAAFSEVDNNEVSVALEICYAGRRITLGGDAIDDNWIWHRKYRKKLGLNITSDIVKLPHHGSRRDNAAETLDDFFRGTDTSIAIISAGGRSHPDLETLELLEKLPCARLCTNLFNPNKRVLKRLYSNESLSTRLKNYLNIYASPSTEAAQPCKGDICISVHSDGSITSSTQHNPLCPCTPMLDLTTGAPVLPTISAI